MKKISVEEAMKLTNSIFVDTRTPHEYEQAHIPGAINIPIFTNEERHEIGFAYKKESIDKAYEIGIKIFGKRLNNYLEEYKKYKDKKIIVYCWRGGMRSKAIASFLDSLDFEVYQLEGGHKAFRNYVIQKLNNYQLNSRLIVLYGMTGSKKTKLIKRLNPSLDLEYLAQHRSSLFGSVGLKPVTQVMFEHLLLFELEKLKNEKYFFVEGESRRIGNIVIPEFLWRKMRQGVNIRVDCNINDRADNIVEEYFSSDEKIRQVEEVIPKLVKWLGHKKVNQLLMLLKKGNYFELTKILLRDYYDIKYGHTVNSIKYDLVVNSENLEKAKEEIEKFVHTLFV